MALDAELAETIARCQAEADGGGTAQLVSVAAPARTDVECAALYTEDGPASLVWEQPDRDVHIVGRGAVASVAAPSSPKRFEAADQRVDDLLQRWRIVSADRALLEPVLMGGFAFAEHTDWALGPGRLILPELTYIRRDGRAAWIRSLAVTAETDIGAVAAQVTRELGRLSDLGGGWLRPCEDAGSQPLNPGDAEYPKLVRRAVEEIDRGELQKVVAARQVEIRQRADIVQLIATLRARYPGCVTFAFRFDDSALVGATPELLARRRLGRVETAAVAGTAPRGRTFDEDHELGMSLLADSKERREHRLVYDEIRARLRASGVTIDDVREPEVLKLPGLQHLWTRITGTAETDVGLLDVVGRLHPTPAVAGLPVAAAASWLADHEALDRGWYAGPIGFVGPSGDGEFRVALRTGLIEGDTVRLFAGAGVVAGSNPDRELAETELKLQTMARALRAVADG